MRMILFAAAVTIGAVAATAQNNPPATPQPGVTQPLPPVDQPMNTTDDQPPGNTMTPMPTPPMSPMPTMSPTPSPTPTATPTPMAGTKAKRTRKR